SRFRRTSLLRGGRRLRQAKRARVRRGLRRKSWPDSIRIARPERNTAWAAAATGIRVRENDRRPVTAICVLGWDPSNRSFRRKSVLCRLFPAKGGLGGGQRRSRRRARHLPRVPPVGAGRRNGSSANEREDGFRRPRSRL